MRRPPRPLEERQARAFDDEIHPLWGERFATLELGALPAKLGGAVLELGCNAGALTRELVARHEGKGRIVALDATPAMIERARTRVKGKGEAPVFFRPHDPAERLPFAEETFDLVLAGPALAAAPDLEAAIADLARVTAKGGRLVVALPLAGTWQEVCDLFAEVLRRPAAGPTPEYAEAALAEYRTSMPDGERLMAALETAGLTDVSLETTRWELLFKSGREFFYAPVIETGPLPIWRAIAAESGDMLSVFIMLKDAIDTYFRGRAFAVSVVAGCISGKRPAASGSA
jgi:ubiquinone/menaquinone biosynthesis C-methylase UbiE